MLLSILIGSIVICGLFAYEAETEPQIRSINIFGSIPEGWTPGDDGNSSASANGMNILARIVTSKNRDPETPTAFPSDGDDITGDKDLTNIDIVHNDEVDKIDSFYIAYGAYGNLLKDVNPSFEIEATASKWKLSEVETDDITLTASTNEVGLKDGNLFYGEPAAEGNKIKVVTNDAVDENRSVSHNAPILVGYTKVTWDVAKNGGEYVTPEAGEYSATIKLTFTPGA